MGYYFICKLFENQIKYSNLILIQPDEGHDHFDKYFHGFCLIVHFCWKTLMALF